MTNISSLPIFYIIHSFFLKNPAEVSLSENWVLLGYYAASSGSSLQNLWDKLLGPTSKFKNPKRNPGPTNEPTNQPTKDLTEGRDLRKSTSQRLSASLAIPALTASLGSVTDTLNCSCDCAYANEFPTAVEDLDVDKLRTIAQGAIDLMRGHKLFGSQVFSYLSCRLHIRTTTPHAKCDFMKCRKVHNLVVQCTLCIVYLVIQQKK
jgi:hypothetical protein